MKHELSIRKDTETYPGRPIVTTYLVYTNSIDGFTESTKLDFFKRNQVLTRSFKGLGELAELIKEFAKRHVSENESYAYNISFPQNKEIFLSGRGHMMTQGLSDVEINEFWYYASKI